MWSANNVHFQTCTDIIAQRYTRTVHLNIFFYSNNIRLIAVAEMDDNNQSVLIIISLVTVISVTIEKFGENNNSCLRNNKNTQNKRKSGLDRKKSKFFRND